MKVWELLELLYQYDYDTEVIILDAARYQHPPTVAVFQATPPVIEIKPDYMAEPC